MSTPSSSPSASLSSTSPVSRSGGRRPQAGPPLPLPILVSVLLFAAGLIITTAMAGKPFPGPGTGDAELVSYVGTQHAALRVGAFFTFGSTVPLAIFAATVTVRLRQLGIRAPGSVIALIGGIIAAVTLALSGFVSSALAAPEVSSSLPLLHALTQFSLMAGGVGYVTGLGLLVAGIAVPGLLAGLLPRWLAVVGLVIAGICELGSLATLDSSLSVLLPIGRFPGLIWLTAAAAAFALPTTRTAANQR